MKTLRTELVELANASDGGVNFFVLDQAQYLIHENVKITMGKINFQNIVQELKTDYWNTRRLFDHKGKKENIEEWKKLTIEENPFDLEISEKTKNFNFAFYEWLFKKTLCID